MKPFKQVDVDEVLKKHSDFYKSLEVINPNKAREDQSVDTGIVLAIGPTAFKDFGGEAWCQVGDKIIFAKFSPKFVMDEELGFEVGLVNDEDCIAVVKETPK